LLIEYDRTDITVTIPEMFEEYDIMLKKINKKQTTKNIKVYSSIKAKPK